MAGYVMVDLDGRELPDPLAELTEQDPARFAVEDLSAWVDRTQKLSKPEIRETAADLLRGYAALRESFRQAGSARDHWIRKASELEAENTHLSDLLTSCSSSNSSLRAERDASLSLVAAAAAADQPLARLRAHLLDAFVALHDLERGGSGGSADA